MVIPLGGLSAEVVLWVSHLTAWIHVVLWPWSLSTSVQEEWPLWGICQRREGRLDTLWIIKLIRVSLWIFMLPSCEQGSTFLELFIADSTAFQARMSTCLGLDDETPHISPLDHWDMVLSFIDSNPKNLIYCCWTKSWFDTVHYCTNDG
jgi:hypothetical protein